MVWPPVWGGRRCPRDCAGQKPRVTSWKPRRFAKKFLDQVAADLRGGGTVAGALDRVADGTGRLAPDIATVRSRTRLGLDLVEALNRWATERPHPGFADVAGALTVARRRAGGPHLHWPASPLPCETVSRVPLTPGRSRRNPALRQWWWARHRWPTSSSPPSSTPSRSPCWSAPPSDACAWWPVSRSMSSRRSGCVGSSGPRHDPDGARTRLGMPCRRSLCAYGTGVGRQGSSEHARTGGFRRSPITASGAAALADPDRRVLGGAAGPCCASTPPWRPSCR